MEQRLTNILARIGKVTCLTLVLFCVGSVQADEKAAPKYKVDAATFRCITKMTSVKHFFVDNLAGNLEALSISPKREKASFLRERCCS